MTIKHLMYMQKVPFLYTERACVVFFQFQNSPWKIFDVERSVATISDQREYHICQHMHNFYHGPMANACDFQTCMGRAQVS